MKTTLTIVALTGVLTSNTIPTLDPALAAQTETPATTPEQNTLNALPALQRPALSRESLESLNATEDRVADLERRIGRLEDRSRNLALRVAQRQLEQLMIDRARTAPAARGTERTSLAGRLDELNRNVIRLTTLVTVLIEQHRPEDEAEPPTVGDADADR